MIEPCTQTVQVKAKLALIALSLPRSLLKQEPHGLFELDLERGRRKIEVQVALFFSFVGLDRFHGPAIICKEAGQLFLQMSQLVF